MSGSLHAEACLRLPGNQKVLDLAVRFRERLTDIKGRIEPPPGRFQGYSTLDDILHLVAALDLQGVDLLELISNARILLVGAGDGDLPFFLSSIGAGSITVVDEPRFSQNGLLGFKTLQAALSIRADLLECGIHRLEIRSLPVFDLAFCINFLHHSPQPTWVFEQLASRCRRVLLTTKVFDHPDPVAWFYDADGCNGDVTTWWCFTPRVLECMARRTGFELLFSRRVAGDVGMSDAVHPGRDGRLFLDLASRHFPPKG